MTPFPGTVECRSCRCPTQYSVAIPASKVRPGWKRGYVCPECKVHMDLLYHPQRLRDTDPQRPVQQRLW